MNLELAVRLHHVSVEGGRTREVNHIRVRRVRDGRAALNSTPKDEVEGWRRGAELARVRLRSVQPGEPGSEFWVWV